MQNDNRGKNFQEKKEKNKMNKKNKKSKKNKKKKVLTYHGERVKGWTKTLTKYTGYQPGTIRNKAYEVEKVSCRASESEVKIGIIGDRRKGMPPEVLLVTTKDCKSLHNQSTRNKTITLKDCKTGKWRRVEIWRVYLIEN